MHYIHANPLKRIQLTPPQSYRRLEPNSITIRGFERNARIAQSMCPSCIDIQSMPSITSKPCDSNITICAIKLCAPILTVKSRHPALAIISPPGELTLIDPFRDSMGSLYLSTNALDMNECDAPVSKSISAG